MALTGRLGTANSMLGNVELATVPNPGAGAIAAVLRGIKVYIFRVAINWTQ